ncbi:hypothetical protein ABZ816_25895 [Actinosynnema sp. NPDC047251]|uniref:SD-repeat containing protein B domain-containing protein n=1 Tax=Saccharothrix espanaensis (strain ATCC 51144 / DSM 44229 / JCM 9112 / NBRC 15066 / NRRL 15764) TaxID=1179773 RepID=K0K0H0_SACES|nr:hypothetical protein BN6_45610 [Saccharothrix espanaensis DSM 44229]
MRKRKVLTALTVAATIAATLPVVAHAEGFHTVKVKVVDDYNGNGKADDDEVKTGGIKDVEFEVLIPDPDGSGDKPYSPEPPPKTDANGQAEVKIPIDDYGSANAIIRVKKSSLGARQAGFASSQGLRPIDLYVTAGTRTEQLISLWNPAKYCSVDSYLVTACQLSHGKDNELPTLVKIGNKWRGDKFNLKTEKEDGKETPIILAKKKDTGVVYGIAHQKSKKRIFSGAFAKRFAPYGPGGSGAIYVTDVSTEDETTKVFDKLPAGSTQHAKEPPAGTLSFNPNTEEYDHADRTFVQAVGRESLGDIEISADEKQLFVVNMYDRTLNAYDISGDSAGKPTTTKIEYSGCAKADDWRPMALGTGDNTLYVGGVCSAETDRKAEDLKAVVLQYDYSTQNAKFTPVLQHPLTYKRGYSWTARSKDPTKPADWNPWSKAADDFPYEYLRMSTYPEPMLADIEVESGGHLVLGFRDRFGDLTGVDISDPKTKDSIQQGAAAGDIIRVCAAGGKFIWEGESGCETHNALSADPPHKEFYVGDNFNRNGGAHQETALGALALANSEKRIAATHLDPIETTYSNGIGWHDRATGERDPRNDSYGIIHWNDNLLAPSAPFGKANGLADLEYICDEAPIQIGNRVWEDFYRGLQNAREYKGLKDITVTLYEAESQGDGDAKVKDRLDSTKTDKDGEYYFPSPEMAGKLKLKPDTWYVVEFDRSSATNLKSGDWTIAADHPDDEPTRNSDIAFDANGTKIPKGDEQVKKAPKVRAKGKTGGPGSVNHDIDAGYDPNGNPSS